MVLKKVHKTFEEFENLFSNFYYFTLWFTMIFKNVHEVEGTFADWNNFTILKKIMYFKKEKIIIKERKNSSRKDLEPSQNL